MARINLIMILLPFVFMIHEYEEIIMFKRGMTGIGKN